MKRFTLFALIPLALVLTLPVLAADPADETVLSRADGRYAKTRIGHGGVVSQNKARADTVYLIGGPGRDDGKFQDATGAPDWEGWTHLDKTAPTVSAWHCDTFNSQNLDGGTVPNHAWWCGETFDNPCGPGYGDDYLEYLDWLGTVPNPTASVTVTINAMLNHHVEQDWDFVYFGYIANGNFNQVASFTGLGEGIEFSRTFTLSPADYSGPGGDQVYLRWIVDSDDNTSDEDCQLDTNGAAQIDLIDVFFNQGSGDIQIGTTEDCEGPTQWFTTLSTAVGDFSKVWPLLSEIDVCRSNSTPQAAFIDDGLVVPGTGGYLCTSWCYGPGGYIVNPEGGMAGQDYYVQNQIESPLLEWPGEQYDGAIFRWDVFSHEELSSVSPGVFYRWFVRSTADPAGVDGWDSWQSDNTVWYGPGVFLRHDFIVTDAMVPGRRWVQLALSCEEWGWLWGFLGTDGTPSPYFDNISFAVYEFAGPAINSDELYIAQDNFPEIGTYDYTNLGQNSIRFDMALNISPSGHQRYDSGDSIIADVVPVRTGSVLNDRPKLFYKMKANPVFDSARLYPTEGWVYGDSTYSASGSIVENRWNFDLPDTGLLFPGDVLHYYFQAQDNIGGQIGTSLMPADTTGFSDFDKPMSYQQPYGLNEDPNFTVRGLPTFETMAAGDHPAILFINDNANRGLENEFSFAFQNLGYKEGVDYDMFYVNGPDAGDANSIGERSTATQLAGYETIIYACGNLFTGTICNGDYTFGGSDDVGVLDSWLRLGNKNMFLSGDELAFDLNQSGAATLAFLNSWIGVTLNAQDLRPLIGNQATPTVRALPGNGVFNTVSEWIAYGGCLGLNRFDAVSPIGTTQVLAEFLDENGASGQYPYAAATLRHDATYNNDIIYMPYSWHYIYTVPNGGGPLASRTLALQDILFYFGHIGSSPTVNVPEAKELTVKNFPNPFNPATKIAYNMPQRGKITIKLFNIRGELVKVLLNEEVEAGANHVIWDGTDAAGQQCASGIYFYETQALGKTMVNKMALVK